MKGATYLVAEGRTAGGVRQQEQVGFCTGVGHDCLMEREAALLSDGFGWLDVMVALLQSSSAEWQCCTAIRLSLGGVEKPMTGKGRFNGQAAASSVAKFVEILIKYHVF